MSTANTDTIASAPVKSFAARHPFLVSIVKEGGRSFLISAAIGFGLLAGARVATLGMKPIDESSSDNSDNSDNSAPTAE